MEVPCVLRNFLRWKPEVISEFSAWKSSTGNRNIFLRFQVLIIYGRRDICCSLCDLKTSWKCHVFFALKMSENANLLVFSSTVNEHQTSCFTSSCVFFRRSLGKCSKRRNFPAVNMDKNSNLLAFLACDTFSYSNSIVSQVVFCAGEK